MDTKARAADSLTALVLAGPWTLQAVGAAIETVLGPIHGRTHAALAARIFALAEKTYPPAPGVLSSYLYSSEFLKPVPGRPIAVVLVPPRFAPLPPFLELPIPALATLAELGEWLGVTPEQLDWFSGERGGHAKAASSPLQHYNYSFQRKRSGAARLIEAPKPRLKAMQRRILHEILAKIPVHDCARGFVRGRSCLDGAQLHAGEAMVMTLDLAQFFPSIGLPRIHGIFRSIGYPWAVARRLTGLCTTATPKSVFALLPQPLQPDAHTRAMFGVPHLPQGAPTSPALVNMLAWRLDRRLHGLSRAANAQYSRYADDLAFSGDTNFAAGLGRFRKSAEAIIQQEGFALNSAKTRIMPRSTRQIVTGIVVNQHCNVSRAAFDSLKAVLHNCIRTGPAAQNHADVMDFRRHLDGRVVWLEQVNPRRGARLRYLFDQIVWQTSAAHPDAGG